MSDQPNLALQAILARHMHLEGPLLPILHDVQEEFGVIPEDVIAPIAKALNLSRAEVFGVVSFYHDFRREPAGRRVLKLCRAESCQARGCEALGAELCNRLGIDWHQTSASGVTLEPVYCLGLCAMGPAALLDGQPLARLDADKVMSRLEAAQ